MPAVFEGGTDASGLRFAIVVARFNDYITSKLLDGAVATLQAQGAADADIAVFWVPGAFEIPLVAKTAATSGRYHAVLCLGAVIQGETDHYRLVTDEATRGIARAALDSGVPCILEVLATETVALAQARAGGAMGNKGEEAALAAIEVARVLAQVRDQRKS